MSEDTPQEQPVQGTPVDIEKAAFHPAGTTMDIVSQVGARVRYKLTPQGWQLVKEP